MRQCDGCDVLPPDDETRSFFHRGWWNLGGEYHGFYCPACTNLLYPAIGRTPDPEEVTTLKVKIKLKLAI